MSVMTGRALVAHAAKDVRLETQEIPAKLQDTEVHVQVEAGGICGSDLHYYNHGGFGAIRLREPMILGHEVSGIVRDTGAQVSSIKIGDRVAVSPSRPCGHCRYCKKAQYNQCLNMRFYGSAMPFPHIQGAFRDHLVADEQQCVPANDLSSAEAAMAEPLAVTLHATRQAGSLLGKRVLITGSGPIGVLSCLSARRAGASEIVVTDLENAALAHARTAGADQCINVRDNSEALSEFSDNKGHFDVLYECSGAQVALHSGIAALAPGGVIVQLGLSGDMTLPMMSITAKELKLCGSFRFHEEFALAVSLMQSGLIDVKPHISHTLPLSQATDAFELANDRQQAMKVQLDFSQN